MSDEEVRGSAGDAILESLTPEQRGELERKQYVPVGEDLVWIEPEGALRREPAASLYYIRTSRGVFRVSRIRNEVIEV